MAQIKIRKNNICSKSNNCPLMCAYKFEAPRVGDFVADLAIDLETKQIVCKTFDETLLPEYNKEMKLLPPSYDKLIKVMDERYPPSLSNFFLKEMNVLTH